MIMYYDADLRIYCKAQAKAAIHKQFWPSMLASLICIVPITLAGFCYSFEVDETMQLSQIISKLTTSFIISLLLEIFIVSPIIMGAFIYFSKNMKHANGAEKPSFFELFTAFESAEKYFVTVKTALFISIYAILWCLLLSVVMTITLSLIYVHIGFSIIAFVVTIPLSIFISAKLSCYYGAYVLLAENPEMGALSAVKQSARLFKGHLWELFVFELSFIGWGILSVITFGIAGIYTFSYFMSAFICYVSVLNPQNQLPQDSVSI